VVNWQVVANIVHDIIDMGKWHQASKGEVLAAGLGQGEGGLRGAEGDERDKGQQKQAKRYGGELCNDDEECDGGESEGADIVE